MYLRRLWRKFRIIAGMRYNIFMSPQPFALVTGAAQRLGRIFALQAARQGYHIALHYHHSAAEARQTAAEIRSLGRQALLLQADLRQPAQINTLFEELDRSLGSTPGAELRLLVNSAATMTPAEVLTLTPAAWDDTLALNLRAPFFCAQQAARRMPVGGHIINISDSGAEKNWVGYPDYLLSKAALEHLTRLLARALAPTLRVNAIAPGLSLPAKNLPAALWQRLLQRLPLPRPAAETDLASALEFLLKNEYITGQVLRIDGGYALL